MSAPVLEYIAMLTFFLMGLIVQVLAVCYYNIKSLELENKEIEVKPRSGLNIVFGLALSALAMYFTYSLADWARSDIGYAILAVHWTGVIYSNFKSFSKKVKIKGTELYLSLAYVVAMVAMLIIYGVQCL